MTLTPVQAQTLFLTTSDNITIHGELSIPETYVEKYPVVILIHQGGSDHTEWDFILPALLAKNYAVLAYDVRGHGKSTPVESIYPLFNNPKLAPKDLLAVLAYLKSKNYIDNDRIAVVGSSVGANLANVAIANMGVKTAVAMSGKTTAVQNLAASKILNMQSVFYISSNESEGARALWAKELYQMTQSPRRLTIVPGSQAHGVGIFKDKADLQQEVLEWLGHTL